MKAFGFSSRVLSCCTPTLPQHHSLAVVIIIFLMFGLSRSLSVIPPWLLIRPHPHQEGLFFFSFLIVIPEVRAHASVSVVEAIKSSIFTEYRIDTVPQLSPCSHIQLTLSNTQQAHPPALNIRQQRHPSQLRQPRRQSGIQSIFTRHGWRISPSSRCLWLPSR